MNRDLTFPGIQKMTFCMPGIFLLASIPACQEIFCQEIFCQEIFLSGVLSSLMHSAFRPSGYIAGEDRMEHPFTDARVFCIELF